MSCYVNEHVDYVARLHNRKKKKKKKKMHPLTDVETQVFFVLTRSRINSLSVERRSHQFSTLTEIFQFFC